MAAVADDEIPTFDAWRTPDGRQLTFFCPHCRHWHYHGGGIGEFGSGDGHREAHCVESDALQHSGYLIREVGTISRAVTSQYRPRRGYNSPQLR